MVSQLNLVRCDGHELNDATRTAGRSIENKIACPRDVQVRRSDANIELWQYLIKFIFFTYNLFCL